LRVVVAFWQLSPHPPESQAVRHRFLTTGLVTFNSPYTPFVDNSIMDSMMLRDEAARDRVRQALEFLDPRTNFLLFFPPSAPFPW
jgi:hypothetical protein